MITAWLTSHVLSALGGGLLGQIGHGVSWWLEKKGQEGPDEAGVQKASYSQSDPTAHIVLTVLLLAMMTWAIVTDQPAALQHALITFAGMSVSWLTGKLTLKNF